MYKITTTAKEEVKKVSSDGWYNDNGKNFFVLDQIKKCLQSLTEESLEHYKLLCKSNNEVYRLQFKRDLIQSLINMIEYYIHCRNFIKAQQILEEYSSCFKFCQDINKSDCGCKTL